MRAAARMLLAAALCAPLGAWSAAEMRVSELIGKPVQDARGKPVGEVTEAIVDLREGRVVYAVIGGPQRYYTYPMRALQASRDAGVLEVDTTLAGAIARSDGDAVRFARASRLIGQEVGEPGGERIGVIDDFAFGLENGRIAGVLVRTPEGVREFPSAVLASGNFPPLTRWQAENPPSGAAGDSGYLRRKPSRERRSLQGPPESR